MDAGVCFINAIPVFIASEPKWQQAFESRGLTCAGDDVMSQLGATVLHKTLVKLFVDRGVKVDETYQLNVGGDMDFYNMLDEEMEDKRVARQAPWQQWPLIRFLCVSDPQILWNSFKMTRSVISPSGANTLAISPWTLILS